MKCFWMGLLGMAGAMAEPAAMKFTAKDGTEVSYRLATPSAPEQSKVYPLVLFLHGAGERGTDNRAQLKHGVRDILKTAEELGEETFLIAPQCPPDLWWAEPTPDRLELRNNEAPNRLLGAVLALVEETAAKHPVDRNRIYVTGLSMGGFGTWWLLERSPDTWAAAVPICGGGHPEAAGRMRNIPIRIFHGGADEVISVKSSERMNEALAQVNARSELQIYEGVGHDSWTRTYRNAEVIRWMFSQRKKIE